MKKSIGELIDQLGVTNNKIFYLVNKLKQKKHTRVDAKKIKALKKLRTELVKAINEHFDEKKAIKKGVKKSIGELTDELSITNVKIFYLIEKVYQDKHTREDAQKIQDLNKSRTQLANAINKYFGDKKKVIKV